MAPLQLSVVWYRRFFIAIAAAALVYGALYITHTAITKPLFNGGGFDLIALIGAVISLALATAGIFLSQQQAVSLACREAAPFQEYYRAQFDALSFLSTLGRYRHPVALKRSRDFLSR